MGSQSRAGSGPDEQQESGIMTYEEYLDSPEWKEKQQAVLERDGHRCVACNRPDQLEIHHRTYERIGNELLSDLTTLCRACHGTISSAADVVHPPTGTYVRHVRPYTIEKPERREVEISPESQAIAREIEKASTMEEKRAIWQRHLKERGF